MIANKYRGLSVKEKLIYELPYDTEYELYQKVKDEWNEYLIIYILENMVKKFRLIKNLSMKSIEEWKTRMMMNLFTNN